MQTRQWWSWQSYCQRQTTLSLFMPSMRRIPATLSLLLPPHVRHSEVPKLSHPVFSLMPFLFPHFLICSFLMVWLSTLVSTIVPFNKFLQIFLAHYSIFPLYYQHLQYSSFSVALMKQIVAVCLLIFYLLHIPLPSFHILVSLPTVPLPSPLSVLFPMVTHSGLRVSWVPGAMDVPGHRITYSTNHGSDVKQVTS